MADAVDRYFNSIKEKPTVLAKTIDWLRNHEKLSKAFQYNLFTQDIEHAQDNFFFSPTAKKGSLVTDTDTSLLRAFCTKTINFSPSDNNLSDAIIDIAMDIRYHPIKNYLESLRWDGIERLDQWMPLILGCEDNAYTRAVGRKLFVAAVARIYNPGCEFHQLVILEGSQGIYKSRLVRAIGGEWYAPIELTVHDRKSMVDTMRGKWILEVEELAGFSKSDVERMKAFLSCPSDRVRLSYGRRSIDFKRQCVLIGTLNPDGENKYLADIENRRFWPIDCGDKKIRLDDFKAIRDQLFAEAIIKYNSGEQLFLDNEEEEIIAKQEQEKRQSVDPWQSIIEGWIEMNSKEFDLNGITTTEILTECLHIPKERINSGLTRRIAKIFKILGWRVKRTNKDNRTRVYIKEEKIYNYKNEEAHAEILSPSRDQDEEW